MRYFIFLTQEGLTKTPQNVDIENLQVLGIASGSNEKEAFGNLIKENDYLKHTGFKEVLAMELANEKHLTFVKETGFKELIVSQKIKNLVDYMIGVEAGLDSNGRKNRNGHSMENIVGFFIQDLCKTNKLRFLKEANSSKIQKELGYDVPVDKSSRRYDFVVSNGEELLIFETNYFSGSGSKLKSTAGEYRNLFDVLDRKYKFIWITDGFGWKSTSRPLRETFDHNDYVFSLSMLEKGILDFIVPSNNNKALK